LRSGENCRQRGPYVPVEVGNPVPALPGRGRRVFRLARRLIELKAGSGITADDVERAAHFAELSRVRAEAAHRSAAPRHDEAAAHPRASRTNARANGRGQPRRCRYSRASRPTAPWRRDARPSCRTARTHRYRWHREGAAHRRRKTTNTGNSGVSTSARRGSSDDGSSARNILGAACWMR